MDALHDFGSSSDDEDDVERGVVHRGSDPSNAVVRSQPHVNGNWAGHCYIRLRFQRRIQRQVAKGVECFVHRLERAGYSGNCQSFLPDGDASSAILHLSLSRTFYLQAANLDPFLQGLTKQLANVVAFPISLNTFGNQLLLHNDERTRSFLVWPILPLASAHDHVPAPLVQLVRFIDACLALYKLPSYYDPPIFHVSLASFVPAVSEHISSRLNNKFDDDDDDIEASSSSSSSSDGEESGLHIISEIHCAFGTAKHFVIPLCPR